MSTRPRRGGQVRADLARWLPPIVLAAVAAATFTFVIRANELLAGERAITRWFADLNVAGIRTIVDVLDYISSDAVAPIVYLAILPITWWAWGRYAALAYAGTGGITALTRVSDLASRPRPTEDLQWAEAVFGSGGYPSGHVVYAVLVFGMLAYLAGYYMRPGRARFLLQVLLIAIVVGMGPARVINLDHWAMDVLGSYVLALPFLLLAIWLHPRIPGWLNRTPRLQSLVGADRE